MTEKPKCQTVAEAAEEWLHTLEGDNAFCDALHSGNPSEQMKIAFCAGVKWMADEVNEVRRRAGSRR